MKSLLLFALLLPQTPAPKYGWVVFQDETFSTNTNEIRRIDFGESHGSAKIMLSVEADSAVSVGFAGTEWAIAEQKRVSPRLSQFIFPNGGCNAVRVLKTSRTCAFTMDGDVSLVIRDDRGLITATVGMLGIQRGGTSATDRAIKPNSVHIILRTWACIENCPS